MNINNLLIYGRKYLSEQGVPDSQFKSRVLLSHILGIEKIQLIINALQDVDNITISNYKNALKKLAKGTPIQYITNTQEFMKLNFYVDENVLIPQPDTEILVEEVINYIENHLNNNTVANEPIRILDLCTGSGAIAISLAKNIQNCNIIATDISSKALQIAKLNAERNLVRNSIHFIESDMFLALNDFKNFDIIVSNPPYIETSTIKNLSKEVKSEPILALDGGADGLDFYRIIFNNGYEFLNDTGKVFVEIGYNQRLSVFNLIEETLKYEDMQCIQDLSGNDRVIIASKKQL